jgi:hypothetical protein
MDAETIVTIVVLGFVVIILAGHYGHLIQMPLLNIAMDKVLTSKLLEHIQIIYVKLMMH